MKGTLLLLGISLAIVGCENPNAIPAHTASEQKAIDNYNKMSPQQKIDLIQKGPLPESAKNSMIQKIKDTNGLK